MIFLFVVIAAFGGAAISGLSFALAVTFAFVFGAVALYAEVNLYSVLTTTVPARCVEEREREWWLRKRLPKLEMTREEISEWAADHPLDEALNTTGQVLVTAARIRYGRSAIDIDTYEAVLNEIVSEPAYQMQDV